MDMDEDGGILGESMEGMEGTEKNDSGLQDQDGGENG